MRRIKSLAVPPAYEDVWICPIPNGHLQATARDNVAAVLRTVAEKLGNTPTVCRNSYIHPLIVDEYLAASVLLLLHVETHDESAERGLLKDELRVIRTIEKLLKRYAASSAK